MEAFERFVAKCGFPNDGMQMKARKRSTRYRFIIISMLVAGNLFAAGQVTEPITSSSLESGFLLPPDSAKPRVWWHWMSGNVTEKGITADLEWMHRVGIDGMQMFDGDMGAPLFVDKPVIWMSPEWKSAWRKAASEADRLHMEMSMAASGGWSETAGPWVKPATGHEEICMERNGHRRTHTLQGICASLRPRWQVSRSRATPAAEITSRPDAARRPSPAARCQSPAHTRTCMRTPQSWLFRPPRMRRQPRRSRRSLAVADRSRIAVARTVPSPRLSRSPTLTNGPHGLGPVCLPRATTRAGRFVRRRQPASPFGGLAIPTGKIEASDDGQPWRTLVEYARCPRRRLRQFRGAHLFDRSR